MKLQKIFLTLLVISSLLQTACGGGGSSSNSSGTTTTPPPVVGGGTTTLPPSATTPPPVAKSTAQVSWAAPTIRADGKALLVSELGHYELFITGDNGDDYSYVSIAGTATSFEITTNVGTYHAAISACDTSGLCSELSSVVTFEMK